MNVFRPSNVVQVNAGPHKGQAGVVVKVNEAEGKKPASLEVKLDARMVDGEEQPHKVVTVAADHCDQLN